MGQNANDAVGYDVYLLMGKIGVNIRSKYSYFNKIVTVPLDQWFHFAFTYSGKNGLTIYVNGNQT